jgi:hypothetical protein
MDIELAIEAAGPTDPADSHSAVQRIFSR